MNSQSKRVDVGNKLELSIKAYSLNEAFNINRAPIPFHTWQLVSMKVYFSSSDRAVGYVREKKVRSTGLEDFTT